MIKKYTFVHFCFRARNIEQNHGGMVGENCVGLKNFCRIFNFFRSLGTKLSGVNGEIGDDAVPHKTVSPICP